jgi:hypothetical protein
MLASWTVSGGKKYAPERLCQFRIDIKNQWRSKRRSKPLWAECHWTRLSAAI